MLPRSRKVWQGSRSWVDMIIAAVAEANGCTLVTGNEKHFAGLELINPMRPQA
jgi:toxin FitB